MQGLLAVMWLLAPGADGAAQPAVYKCADGQGGHLYQSMPCAVGATLRRWDIPPASVDTAPPPRTPGTSTRPAPRSASGSESGARTPRSSAARKQADPHARCLAARTDRETSLARLGMKRRYEDLRRLNDRVSAACNHRSGR